MKKNGETTLADVVESINSLRTSMEAGFSTLTIEVGSVKRSVDRLTTRFDRSLLTAGKRGVDHERRISRLEHQVAKLKPTG